jgi:hypothetical protein
MTSVKKFYSELLSLTQLFLLREYQLTDVKYVDPSTLVFFHQRMKPLPPLNRASQKPKPQIPLSPLTTPQPRISTIPPLSDSTPPQEPEPLPPIPVPPLPQPPSPEPRPPIIQDKSNKTNRDAKVIALEPLTVAPVAQDNSEFWKLFPLLFPDLNLCETMPSDAVAQKLKNVWLHNQAIPPVIILSFQNDEKELAFLKNLAQALSLRLAPARVLSAPKFEKEKAWKNILKSPPLQLVIASDYGLYLQSGLMEFYRTDLQQGKHFLNDIPLLLLSDLSLYLKEPQLKSLLWRAVCNEFSLKH